MLNIKEKTCCFTGHRIIPVGQQPTLEKKLEDKIEKLIHNGIIYFGAGGALGFDTLAALSVLELKSKYPQIKLILVLPCEEQADKWNDDDIKRYKGILGKADKVKYTSAHYTRDCMHIRNRHLVDHSGYCICYLIRGTGGTDFTVRYAVRSGLQIINIADMIM